MLSGLAGTRITAHRMRFAALASVAALVAVVAIAGPFAQRADAATTDLYAGNASQFQGAISTVNAAAASDADPDNFVIHLTGDIDYTDAFGSTLAFNSGTDPRNVTIDGGGVYGVSCTGG